MQTDIVRKLIEEEFAELFTLTGTKWFDDLDGQSIFDIRKTLLIQALDTINQFIRFGDTEGGINRKKALDAIRFIFENFESGLLYAVPKKRYLQIITYTVLHRPAMLGLIVDHLSRYFYIADPETQSDFTFVVLTFVQNDVPKGEWDVILPVMYKLFVNPSERNPQGAQSKDYSASTRTKLKESIKDWSKYTPNIWDSTATLINRR